VLAEGWDSSCPPKGDVPALVRTNIGLARRGMDGAWTYVCPSAWGGPELALLVADPSGSTVVVASSEGVRLSRGGEDRFEVVRGLEGTPVALVWAEGRAWGLLVEEEGATLWSVTRGGAVERHPIDVAPDGLLVDDGVVWFSGALPEPWMGRLDRGALVPLQPPLGVVLDRLSPRALRGEELTLLAGAGAERWLWEVVDGEIVDQAGPGEAVIGPVEHGGARWAVVDGVLWRDAGKGWSATDDEVDWTCLQAGDNGVWACSLRGVLAVDPADPIGSERLVFSLEQLGGPTGPLAGVCALDWQHFGGESGWLDTAPASCPDEARAAIEEVEGCGCAHGSPLAGWALLWWPLRRRRIAIGR
jgi:hypothetical protein